MHSSSQYSPDMLRKHLIQKPWPFYKWYMILHGIYTFSLPLVCPWCIDTRKWAMVIGTWATSAIRSLDFTAGHQVNGIDRKRCRSELVTAQKDGRTTSASDSAVPKSWDWVLKFYFSICLEIVVWWLHHSHKMGSKPHQSSCYVNHAGKPCVFHSGNQRWLAGESTIRCFSQL